MDTGGGAVAPADERETSATRPTAGSEAWGSAGTWVGLRAGDAAGAGPRRTRTRGRARIRRRRRRRRDGVRNAWMSPATKSAPAITASAARMRFSPTIPFLPAEANRLHASMVAYRFEFHGLLQYDERVRRVAVIGVGVTTFGKHDRSSAELFAEAAAEALSDADLSPAAIQALCYRPRQSSRL